MAQGEKSDMTDPSCDVSKQQDSILVRIRSVADPEYLQQSQSYQISDCETTMAKVREAFEARKLGPMLDQFETPLLTIDRFVRGITVLVQGLDPTAQIIWGGFLIVLKAGPSFIYMNFGRVTEQSQNAVRFVDLISTILNCVCHLSKMLARFQIFKELYATERVTASLCDVKNIEAAEKDFKQEVRLQQAIETHELAQTVKPNGPKIPCHIMSSARNRLFFPRPDIMEQIEAHFFPEEELSPPGLRSFLLHGLGGSGKTQLASHFAHTHWDDYDIIKQHYKWLIVFDNVDNEQLLRDYWPNSAKGSILITSRQSILGTTMVDSACEIGSLEVKEGAFMIQLLLENKVSDAQNRHLVEEMAKALGGLPLALAQMAGYLRTNQVTIREFLGNYEDREYARTLFGRATSLDHQQHQQTLETVWRLSFQKLSAEAKTLLRIVVFLHPDEIPNRVFQIPETPAGMPLPSALKILEKSNNTFRYQDTLLPTETYQTKLTSAVQRSALYELLDRDDENVQIALSGAVQILYHAYPRQCPLGKPIPNWPACQKYTTHVLHLLSLYETETKVREKADTNTLKLLTELLCDCGVYLWARCLFGDAERLARASIEVADRVLEHHDCLRAQPYTLLGCICIRSGNRREEAVKSLETALRIRQENVQVEYKRTDPPLHIDIQLANAYSNLGIAAKQMGDFGKAAKLHEQAIGIKERQRDHCKGFLLALSMHNVGKLRRLQGRVEEAVKYFCECNDEMSIYKDDQEMKARQAVWLCALAEAEACLERVQDAEVHFTESLQTLKKVMRGSLDTGTTCLRFGAFKYRAGRYDEALALFKDAEKIFSAKPEAGLDDQALSKNMLAYSLHWLSRTHAELGKEYDSKEAQRGASELYAEIAGKGISLDPKEAVKEYEKLVSDD
ncbi:hypothetical protein N0V84_005367 [Fusarium piperis]|uniref:NB-ARC domain-containing protein n=1 Tax=Fusarium piperis TaxID=1435070 RepID=A0A9W8WE07_9HYPO|nr:hypothetical protein N0V84_005367 [Fusarium piperis]